MGTLTKEPLSVFISSTFSDLADYRKPIIDGLQRLHYVVVNMEQFGARSQDAYNASAIEVSRAQLFVSIITLRYGHVAPGRTLSASEYEYDQAVKENLPIFMYVPDAQHPPELIRSANEAEEAYRFRFLQKVQQGPFIYEDYQNPNHLAYLIITDLINHDTEGLAFTASRKATEALLRKDFATAKAFLEKAVAYQPDDGAIAFKYALALLGGLRPGQVREQGLIVQVEHLLRTSLLNKRSKEAYLFWAIVKKDYWGEIWRYEDESQDAQTLRDRAASAESNSDLLNVLYATQPEAIRKYAAYFQ